MVGKSPSRRVWGVASRRWVRWSPVFERGPDLDGKPPSQLYSVSAPGRERLFSLCLVSVFRFFLYLHIESSSLFIYPNLN